MSRTAAPTIIFLVDSNVLSETTKPRPSAAVLAWLRLHETEFAVNPIVLGELQAGINVLAAGRRKNLLSDWFADVVRSIPVFVIDAITAYAWAGLSAEMRRKGRSMPIKDSLIAATAIQHELTIVTRNIDDFRHAGVKTHNPFDD